MMYGKTHNENDSAQISSNFEVSLGHLFSVWYNHSIAGSRCKGISLVLRIPYCEFHLID